MRSTMSSKFLSPADKPTTATTKSAEVYCRPNLSRGEIDTNPVGRLPDDMSVSEYQVVFYHFDANLVHAELVKSRSAAAVSRAINFFVDSKLSGRLASWITNAVTRRDCYLKR